MGRIADKFQALREKGTSALVTFVTAGDPTSPLPRRLCWN